MKLPHCSFLKCARITSLFVLFAMLAKLAFIFVNKVLPPQYNDDDHQIKQVHNNIQHSFNMNLRDIGALGHVFEQSQKNMDSNVMKTGGRKTGHNWDRKPPFSTHSLTQLEILYHLSPDQSITSLPVNLTWDRADAFTSKRRRFPACVIIGVNKAGTLALLQFLNLHPQVVRPPASSTGKSELNFFNSAQYGVQGYQGYLKMMPVSQPGQMTVEKSPGYFRSSTAPHRIHRFYKNSAHASEGNTAVKLLLIVRDPVQRTVSEYLQRKMAYKTHSLNISSAVKSYPSFEEIVTIRDENTGKLTLNTKCKIITNSIYVKHIGKWLKLFNRNQLHIVDGDKFRQSPLPELHQVQTWLGLPQTIQNSQLYFNKTRGFYCYRKSTGENECLKQDKGLQHPEIDQSLLSELYQYFKPYNEEFFTVIGQRMNWN